LAKPRSYIGFGALTLLIGVILVAMKADGKSFISFVTASFEQTLSFNGEILNGNLMAFVILQMLIIHVPLLVALVTGDLVSGEAAMGTLRMMATKPISRSAILGSKLLAGAIYTFLLTLWMAFMAYGIGQWMFGAGDLIVLNNDGLVIIPADDIMWRYFYGFGLAYLSLLAVATMSICFSVFSDNSIGPIVSTMAVIILFTIIGSLDVSSFNSLQPFLLTTHMSSWRSLFEMPVPVDDILNSIYILLFHIIGFAAISFWRFNKKDINT
jgi:ABC-2 type transport system permease protein